MMYIQPVSHYHAPLVKEFKGLYYFLVVDRGSNFHDFLCDLTDKRVLFMYLFLEISRFPHIV